jgi:hypothetical protein
MSAVSQRRLRLGGLIVGVLYGSVVALLTGGVQHLVSGAMSGVMLGIMFSVVVEDFAGIPRRALIGGVVVAALFVAVDLRFGLKPATDALTLPFGALSGFSLGALLSAPPVRFVLVGALLGALPMPLIGFIFQLIQPYSPALSNLVVLGLSIALLLVGIGWMVERSLANFWRWAILGAVIGLVFAGLTELGMWLFSGPRLLTSRPIPAERMLSLIKMLAQIGGLAGAILGAATGIRTMDSPWPKFLARTQE